MKKIRLKFTSKEQVLSFINCVQDLPGEYDLVEGRKDIDAKSALGVMSLDFSKAITLVVYADEEYPWVMDKLARFAAKPPVLQQIG